MECSVASTAVKVLSVTSRSDAISSVFILFKYNIIIGCSHTQIVCNTYFSTLSKLGKIVGSADRTNLNLPFPTLIILSCSKCFEQITELLFKSMFWWFSLLIISIHLCRTSTSFGNLNNRI